MIDLLNFFENFMQIQFCLYIYKANCGPFSTAAVQKHARVNESAIKSVLSEYLKQATKRMHQKRRLHLLKKLNYIDYTKRLILG